MSVFVEDFNMIGPEQPLACVVGQLILLRLTIVDKSGDPVNIIGRVYTARIGPGGGASAIATFTQVPNDPGNGLVDLSLDTTGLTAGEYRMLVWEDQNFLWGGQVHFKDPDVVA